MRLDRKTAETTVNSGSHGGDAGNSPRRGRLLTFAAVIESLTGVALIVDPEVVVRLLLGAEPSGVGIAISRVAGIALCALGLACWPTHDGAGSYAGAPLGMLAYNLMLTVYLLYLGIDGAMVGALLWPATALHAILTFLLIGRWLKGL